jgi:hypothetical protein
MIRSNTVVKGSFDWFKNKIHPMFVRYYSIKLPPSEIVGFY